jgi:hypothetical protein
VEAIHSDDPRTGAEVGGDVLGERRLASTGRTGDPEERPRPAGGELAGRASASSTVSMTGWMVGTEP